MTKDHPDPDQRVTFSAFQEGLLKQLDSTIFTFEVFDFYFISITKRMIKAKTYNYIFETEEIQKYLNDAQLNPHSIMAFQEIFENALLECFEQKINVSEQLLHFIRIIPTMGIIAANLHLNLTESQKKVLSKEPFKLIFEALNSKGEVIQPDQQKKYDPRIIGGIQLQIFCLDPSIVFKIIQSQGPRCILFASGTLDPIPSLQNQLGIPFAEPIRNPHVIQPKQQVLSRVIGKGPKSSADNRAMKLIFSKDAIKEEGDFLYIELGKTVEDLIRNIPNGVLIVFPSYEIMDGCLNVWNMLDQDGNSIMNRINSIKKVFFEQKEQKQFQESIDLYKENSETDQGAIYFCIQRAKATEGIDFSDKNARAVIIIGIPYASLVAPQIQSKKEFLDKNYDLFKLKGGDWWTQEAIKVVNQSIGRVIRHDKDYGAIYFVDSRYLGTNHYQLISDWAKPDFLLLSLEQIVEDTKQFFEAAPKYVQNKKKAQEGFRQKFKSPQKSLNSIPQENEDSLDLDFNKLVKGLEGSKSVDKSLNSNTNSQRSFSLAQNFISSNNLQVPKQGQSYQMSQTLSQVPQNTIQKEGNDDSKSHCDKYASVIEEKSRGQLSGVEEEKVEDENQKGAEAQQNKQKNDGEMPSQLLSQLSYSSLDLEMIESCLEQDKCKKQINQVAIPPIPVNEAPTQMLPGLQNSEQENPNKRNRESLGEQQIQYNLYKQVKKYEDQSAK